MKKIVLIMITVMLSLTNTINSKANDETIIKEEIIESNNENNNEIEPEVTVEPETTLPAVTIEPDETTIPEVSITPEPEETTAPEITEEPELTPIPSQTTEPEETEDLQEDEKLNSTDQVNSSNSFKMITLLDDNYLRYSEIVVSFKYNPVFNETIDIVYNSNKIDYEQTNNIFKFMITMNNIGENKLSIVSNINGELYNKIFFVDDYNKMLDDNTLFALSNQLISYEFNKKDIVINYKLNYDTGTIRGFRNTDLLLVDPKYYDPNSGKAIIDKNGRILSEFIYNDINIVGEDEKIYTNVCEAIKKGSNAGSDIINCKNGNTIISNIKQASFEVSKYYIHLEDVATKNHYLLDFNGNIIDESINYDGIHLFLDYGIVDGKVYDNNYNYVKTIDVEIGNNVVYCNAYENEKLFGCDFKVYNESLDRLPVPVNLGYENVPGEVVYFSRMLSEDKVIYHSGVQQNSSSTHYVILNLKTKNKLELFPSDEGYYVDIKDDVNGNILTFFITKDEIGSKARIFRENGSYKDIKQNNNIIFNDGTEINLFDSNAFAANSRVILGNIIQEFFVYGDKLVNINGDVVCNINVNDFYSYYQSSNGEITVRYREKRKVDDKFFPAYKDGKYAIFNYETNQISDYKYDSLQSLNRNGYNFPIVAEVDNEQEIIFINGQIIENVTNYEESNNFILVEQNNSKIYKMFDMNGNLMNDNLYDGLSAFGGENNDNFFDYQNGNLYCLLKSYSNGLFAIHDQNGNLLTDFVYDLETYYTGETRNGLGLSDGLFLLKKNGLFGYVDLNGNEVTDFIYTDAFPYNNGSMLVTEYYDDLEWFTDYYPLVNTKLASKPYGDIDGNKYDVNYLKENEVQIKVYDADTLEQLKLFNIEINDNIIESTNGIIKLNIDDFNGQDNIVINLYANEYCAKTEIIDINKKIYNLSLFRENSNNAIKKVILIDKTGNLNIKDTDLLSQKLYFSGGSDGDFEDGEVAIRCEATDVNRFQIIQNGNIIKENNIEREIILRYDLKLGQAFPQLEGLQPGYPVYIRLIKNDGSKEIKKIGLRISQAASFENKLGDDLSIKFDSNKFELAIPSSVPILGGKNYEISITDTLPLFVEADENGKFSIGVNCKTKEELDEFKDIFKNEIAKDASFTELSNKLKNISENGQFQASDFKFEIKLVGYATFNFLDGNYNPETGKYRFDIEFRLILTATSKISNTTYYITNIGPVFSKIGSEASLGGDGKLKIYFENDILNNSNNTGLGEIDAIAGTFDVKGGIGFTPSVGYGIDGALSVSVEGKLGLDVLLRNFQNLKAELYGNIKLISKALWIFDMTLMEWEGRMPLYDNFAYKLSNEINTDNIIYNSDNYTYNLDEIITNNKTLESDNSIILQTLENSLIRTIVYKNQLYLFYLNVDENTKKTSVYFTTSNDGINFDEPIKLLDDSNGNNLSFDVLLNNDEIHIVYEKLYGSINNNTTLDEAAKQLEIYYSKISLNNINDAKITRITNDEEADNSPVIFDNNGKITIAWINNKLDSVNGFLSFENNNSIKYVDLTLIDNINEQFVSGHILNLDADLINGKPYIVYSEDIDKNPNTNNDTEIIMFDLTNTVIQNLTNDSNADTDVRISTLGGINTMYWIDELGLSYSSDGATINHIPNLIDINGMYQIQENNGNTNVMWISSDEDFSKLNNIKYNGNEWSKKFIYFKNNEMKAANFSPYKLDENFSIIYNEQVYDKISNSYGNNIATKQIIDYQSLNIDDIYYKQDDVKEGAILPLYFTLTNTGTMQINDMDVYVNSEKIGNISNMNLDVGDTKEYVFIEYITQLEINELNDLNVCLKNQDSSYSTEDYNLKYGYTDFKFEVYNDLINGKDQISIKIINNSPVKSDAIINFSSVVDGYEGDQNDLILSSKNIKNLCREDLAVVTFDISDLNLKNSEFKIEIISDKPEIMLNNNVEIVYFGAGTGNETEEIIGIPVNEVKIKYPTDGGKYPLNADKIALSVDVYPNDADDKTIQLTTSDSKIATIEGNCVKFISPGTVTITATTKNGISDSITITILSSFENVKIEGLEDKYYNGVMQYQNPNSIILTSNGKVLKYGIDYKIAYGEFDYVEVGEYPIYIIGIGAYTGNLKSTYKILPKQITDDMVILDNSYIYTGKPIEPLKLIFDDLELVEGKDFAASYSNNINVGTAKIIINGINNFCGEIQKTFLIKKQLLSMKINDGKDLVMTVDTSITPKIIYEPNTGIDKTLRWEVENDDLIKVEEGKISALKCGKTKLKACSVSNTTICQELEVYINNKIQILKFEDTNNTSKSINMMVGDIYQIPLIAQAENQEKVNIYFVNENEEVVKLDNDNQTIKALKPGLSKILIKAGSKTLMINIKAYNVEASEKLKYEIEGYQSSGIEIGDNHQIVIRGIYNKEDITNLCEFSSSNENIVQVDERGVITAIKAGSATISAILKDDPAKRKVSIKINAIERQTVNMELGVKDDNFMYDGTAYITEYDEIGKEYMFLLEEKLYDKTSELLENTKVNWSSNNTSIVSIKKINGQSYGVIKSAGEVVLTCTANDKLKNKESIIIRVKEYRPKIESNKMVVNNKQTQDNKLSIYPSYGNEVIDIMVYDKEGSKYSPEESSKFDFELCEGGAKLVWDKENIKKGNYSEKIIMMTQSGKEYEYLMTISVNDTMPKPSVKIEGKVNLFATENSIKFNIDHKGNNVESMKLIGTQMFEHNFQIDKEGNVSVARYLQKEADNKLMLKGQVEVKYEEYREPVYVNISIPTTTIKPNYKLSDTSIVINKNNPNREARISVLDSKSQEEIDIREMTVTAQENDILESVSIEGNQIVLRYKEEFKNGSVKLELRSEEWTDKMIYSISNSMTTNMMSVSVMPSSLTMNKCYEKTAEAQLRANQNNVEFAAGREELRAGGTSEEYAKLEVYYENGKIKAEIKDESIKSGSYRYSFEPKDEQGNELKTVSVNIKITDTLPSYKFSKTSLSMNKRYSEEAYIETIINKNINEDEIVDIEARLIPTKNSGQEIEDIDIRYEENRIIIRLQEGAKLGTYSYYVAPVYRSGNIGKESKISIKVYDKEASMSISAKGSINPIDREGSQIILSVKYGNLIEEVGKATLDEQSSNKFDIEVDETGNIEIRGKEGAELEEKNYNVIVSVEGKNSKEIISKAMKIKVSQINPSVKISPSSINIYETTNRGSKIAEATIEMSKVNAKIVDIVSMSGETNDEAFETRLTEGNKLEIYLKEGAYYKAKSTATLKYRLVFDGEAKDTKKITTVSIKISDKSQSIIGKLIESIESMFS